MLLGKPADILTRTPLSLNCPGCGAVVKAPREAAGRNGRCPTCGRVVRVPEIDELDDSPDPWEDAFLRQAAEFDLATEPIAAISGKPARVVGGFYLRSRWGGATLSLSKSRVIEQSRRLFSRRERHLLLAGVDAAEIVTQGNPIRLVVGLVFTTIGLGSLSKPGPGGLLVPAGLFLIALFLFLRSSFLVIRQGSRCIVVGTIKDLSPYRAFLDKVLTEAERSRASAPSTTAP